MVFHRKKARIHDIFIGIIIMKILWKAMKFHWWKFHRVFITYWRYQYFTGISLDYISWLNKDVFMAKPPCEMLTFPGVQSHESIMQCVWKQSWQIQYKFIWTCLVVQLHNYTSGYTSAFNNFLSYCTDDGTEVCKLLEDRHSWPPIDSLLNSVIFINWWSFYVCMSDYQLCCCPQLKRQWLETFFH